MPKEHEGPGPRKGRGLYMLNKIKELVLSGEKLARYYEEKSAFESAYKEYLKLGNFLKAGEMLGNMGKWHEAANLYISHNETDRARRAIDNCFRMGLSWETFELENGRTIPIELWLKQKRQVQRFVRYIKYVETRDKRGAPLVVVLAEKLKQTLEFKGAAELYRTGFHLVNKNKDAKSIVNEVWLRYATECLARANMYMEAAECMKELIITEVNIGDALSAAGYNPYRDYTHNLKTAREFNFLPQLVNALADFDPFNITYDLWKIQEPDLSIELFFKYYGRILDKHVSDQEREVRNKKIQYCLNQFVIYYSKKGEFKRAAEIALLNSQKEIAADLFKKAEQWEKKAKENLKQPSRFVVENVKDMEEKISHQHGPVKCPHCGDFVDLDSEVCPGCHNVLELRLCVCGEKIKSHWDRCPACQRVIDHPGKTGTTPSKPPPGEDTKPFKIFS